jgi:hypothetical protein
MPRNWLSLQVASSKLSFAASAEHSSSNYDILKIARRLLLDGVQYSNTKLSGDHTKWNRTYGLWLFFSGSHRVGPSEGQDLIL